MLVALPLPSLPFGIRRKSYSIAMIRWLLKMLHLEVAELSRSL